MTSLLLLLLLPLLPETVALVDWRPLRLNLNSRRSPPTTQSYFGGLLCCAWSPDGRYVAAGGEDDLVSVYGLQERAVVACGEGHRSWVSAVAFDPWACQPAHAPPLPPPLAAEQQQQQGGGAPPESVYRLATGGQDCRAAVWEVALSEEEAAVAAAASSPQRLAFAPGPTPPGSPGKPARSRSGSPTKLRGELPRWRSLEPQGPAAGGPAAERAVIEPSLRQADMPLIAPSALLRLVLGRHGRRGAPRAGRVVCRS